MIHSFITGLTLIALLGCSNKRPGALKISTGEISIILPPGYSSEPEENGVTTVIYAPEKDLFELRFTYHSLAKYLGQRPNMPSEFLRFMVDKKNLQVRQIAGTKWLGMFEPVAHSDDERGKAQHLNGTIALSKGYLTFTLSASEKNAQRPEFKRFAQTDLEKLLASLDYDET